MEVLAVAVEALVEAEPRGGGKMEVKEELLFQVKTPLNIEVRTTVTYWKYLTTIKHPVMKEKINIVKEVLESPDEIRQSKTDKEVFLYYKRFDKLYCVVVRHEKRRVLL